MELKKILFLVTHFADMKYVAKTTSLSLPLSVSDILFPNFHQHTNIRNSLLDLPFMAEKKPKITLKQKKKKLKSLHKITRM